MKRKMIITCCLFVFIIAVVSTTTSCNSIARAAAKYWTNKQIREFIGKCEDKSAIILGSEHAKKYCDCAVDVVAEKYRNYDDVKNASLADVLKVARDCK